MRNRRLDNGARSRLLTACGVLLSSLVLGCAFASLSAFASSDGRTFEMVSPIVKGGYGANAIAAVASDGEGVAFETLGGFDGALANPGIGAYLSQRGPSGWTTTPVIVPATVAPYTADKGPVDYSPDLDASLSTADVGPSAGAAEQTASPGEVILHPSDAPYSPEGFDVLGRFEPVIPQPGTVTHYIGSSQDFSRVFFTAIPLVGFPEAALLPSEGIYELASATGEVRMVGLNNEGRVLGHGCRVSAGDSVRNQRNTIADEGQIVFLSASEKSCGAGQVFARVGGQRTLEVSRPVSGSLAKLDEAERCVEETVPCGAATRARASYVGASADGSRVFFTTSAPLVSEDENAEPDLYMASIGCPGGTGEACEVSQDVVTGLTDVSHSVEGASADVQGVLAVSSDGSRVYFVARGVLSHGPNAEGQMPVAGADNLYVLDTAASGGAVFIGDLCSGPERSGEVVDERCPAQLTETQLGSDVGLWEAPGREVQLAGEDGRFLVFSSFARLERGDADTTKDVYRYDADTGRLQRASIGEAGYDANGNDDAFNAEIAAEEYDLGIVTVVDRGRSRAVTEDGSRVVFSSDGALAPGAVPGEPNVYEWRAGSGGGEGEVLFVAGDARSPVITPSGRDLFFATPVGLVPQDTDGAPDVYDARLGGGFPQPPVAVEPCSGDACQGPLTNPAPLLVPGSEVQAAGGNLPAPVAAGVAPKVKAKMKAKAKAKSKRKKKAGRKRGSGRGRGAVAGRSVGRGR
jgi:hypothetical protein